MPLLFHLKRKKKKKRALKQYTQCHTSQNHWPCRWLSWNLNPGSLPSDPTSLSTIQTFSLSYDMKPTCPHYYLNTGVLDSELTTSLLHTAPQLRALSSLPKKYYITLFSTASSLHQCCSSFALILFYSAIYCILWPGWLFNFNCKSLGWKSHLHTYSIF